MTKILFINYDMHYGGAQRVLVNLLRELSNLPQLEITLFLVRYEGVFLKEVPFGVRIICWTYPMKKSLHEKKYNEILKRGLSILTAKTLGTEKLCYLIRKFYLSQHYDTEIAVKEGISKVMLAKSQDPSSKKVFWIHTDLRAFSGDQSKDDVYYANGDNIICVSEKVKEGFVQLYPTLADKVKVINNIIHIEDIQRKGDMGKDPYKHDALNVVNLGRLSKEKAQDRLIRAHKEILDDGLHHYLHIVGEGDERPHLESLILQLGVGNTVTLWGGQSNPYPYLKHGDIYIHSSVNEGLPTVLFEGIALHRPIVSTRVSGVKEVLKDGLYGLIVENTYEDLKEGYRKILTDELLRSRLIEDTKEYKGNNQENLDQFLKIVCKAEDYYGIQNR
ncbi:MAG: glycosyltransferase [Eubacteriales bacterium]